MDEIIRKYHLEDVGEITCNSEDTKFKIRKHRVFIKYCTSELTAFSLKNRSNFLSVFLINDNYLLLKEIKICAKNNIRVDHVH